MEYATSDTITRATYRPHYEQTEWRCHCGCPMRASDHCPECGCEEWETYCNADYFRWLPATARWNAGDSAEWSTF